MVISGTIYLIDENGIGILRNTLLNPVTGPRTVVFNMDDTSKELEEQFPQQATAATVLAPAPDAIYCEIDGDHEGFINLYYQYLESEAPSLMIASILTLLHKGFDVLLYTPALVEEDSIWTNTLIMNFYTRFGITIGTDAEHSFEYNPQYDPINAVYMYSKGFIDVFDFINSYGNGYPPFEIMDRLQSDLYQFSNKGDYMDFYWLIRRNANMGYPSLKAAVSFD